MRRGVSLFGLLPVNLGIADGRKIVPAGHRIKSHGVKIGDDDLMSGLLQRGTGGARHRAVEAHRLGMNVDNKDAHQLLVQSGRME